jgi:hypothetical protein
MSKKLFFSLIAIAAYCQCMAQDKSGNVSDKIIDHIVGTWKISRGENVPQKNTQKTQHAKPIKEDRLTSLEFGRDGRYKTMDSQKSLDSGSYRINENHHRLYLESDADHEHPKEWDINIMKNTLTLQADSTKTKAHEKYFYTLAGVAH